MSYEVKPPIDELMHYGMPRRSGRYPWGSGEDPYQHGSYDFLSRVEDLKKQGWTETPENIKAEFGMSTTEYRKEKALAKDERRMYQVATAKSMKEDGLSATEIARRMSTADKTINESTVRSWLNEESEIRMNQAQETAKFLRSTVDENGMIDIGTGTERELGISKEKLNQALKILEEEGYPVYSGRFEQATNKGNFTTQKVLCPPGTEHKEIYNLDQVHSLFEYTSDDGGQTFRKFQYPESMDSSRLMIRYKEDGGVQKDGVIELRRGVDDLSLGGSKYSQVRILVDGTHYLKGMAVYSDDMPDGVDVIFNTNKTKDKTMHEVMKPIKDDPGNPFGSLIKANGQSVYIGKDGKEHLSLINKRADEGDWDDWADALPSQFLSKQSLSMAKKQLGLAKADKMAEFDDICSLTNPTIKKHLLNKFADECDSAAVHLKAAALPGQKYHVILPVNSLKDNEVYAPNYENGTKLALIRYPHGGTFEIPILTVNNKHAEARKMLGTDPIDAVCINMKNAERLSGADFDGDTVMCIPTHDRSGKVKITSTEELPGLKGFDSKSYAYSKEELASGKAHIMKNTGTQMGIISNLITDMTLAGAKDSELAAAVRHSMVVIDAEKHKLNYKQSEIDNNITALKKKYQRTVDEEGNEKYGGASTLISRAKGQKTIEKTQGSGYVNVKGKEGYDPNRPEGALIYKKADDLYYTKTKTNLKTGEVVTITDYKKQRTTKMADTDDARTLVSTAKHPMELVYADYANSMKNLANKARLESVNTGKVAYSKTAHDTYADEVRSLDAKLNTALLNAPKEREAQRRANAVVATIQKNNPSLSKDDIKKARQRELSKARTEVGSVSRKDREITITDREWEAIQAGAISENKLVKILNNSNIDTLRERATPRTTSTLSDAKVGKIKAMSNSNYSTAEIAKALGVSTSTVSKYLKGAS